VAAATVAAATARLLDAVSVTAGAVQEQRRHGVSGGGCGADAPLRRCSGRRLSPRPCRRCAPPLYCTCWRILPPASRGRNRRGAVAPRGVNRGLESPPTRLAAAARGPGVGGVYASSAARPDGAGGRL